MKKLKGIWPKLSHFFVPQRSNNHRPKILHPESLMVLVIVAAGFFSLTQTFKFFPSLHNSILGYASDITVQDVVVQTNQKRTELGLHPLTLNTQLSAAALAKAQDMLDNQYWAHTSPSGKQPWDFMKAANYHYRVAGENLARDFYHTSDMVAAWMASPTHKDNILSSQYQQIGVAVVDGRLEGFETTLVVQMFGTPSTASQPAVGDTAASDQALAVESSQPESIQNQELATNQPVVVDNSRATDQSSIHNPVTAVADSDTPLDFSTTDQTVTNQPTTKRSTILSAFIEPITHLSDSPLFSPNQLTKIVFLGVILLVVLTLIYDSIVIGNRKTMRLVGENLGHIILFTCVAFLLILFRGGVIK